MYRIGIIGARRVRQGIGEHVARHLARLGAEVTAIAGTSEESVAAAVAGLASRHGLRVRGYTSAAALLEREAIDILAICSPIPAHEEALLAAAGRDVHVLCDKPVLDVALEPDAPPAGLGDRIRRLAERFAARGRLLATITQWPFTLGAFRRLHPEADLGRPPARLAMWLSPITTGPDMVLDSVPHPLSLLGALAGPGTAEDIEVAYEGAAAEAATVRWTWRHAGGRTAAELRLRRKLDQPRPAGYAIEGREARREVRLADYAMELETPDGSRRAPLPDPLVLRLAGFLGDVARGALPDIEALAGEAAACETITRAAVRSAPAVTETSEVNR